LSYGRILTVSTKPEAPIFRKLFRWQHRSRIGLTGVLCVFQAWQFCLTIAFCIAADGANWQLRGNENRTWNRTFSG